MLRHLIEWGEGGTAVDASSARPMTVGELSRRTGVPVKTLREYTDLGLIYSLGRSPAGYRLFDTDALWCVRFIGELRGLGLTVAEIVQLATTADAAAGGNGEPIGSHLAELLQRSRRRLEQRIAEQQRMLRRIAEFEAAHHTDLNEKNLCWAGDPRCPAV
ncbi:MerR family transcriptional regulator [Actinomadura sp. 9N215]|uniref:MerR family transcriptional regulator n=1 Tax=Actinomadura sp. 9N215 TaxID=3375150 RepID=UPI00378D679B